MRSASAMNTNDADMAMQQVVRLIVIVLANLEHQRFDSGKYTRERPPFAVHYAMTILARPLAVIVAVLAQLHPARIIDMCCTGSAEGDRSRGMIGNQRRGGTTSDVKWPVSPLV